MIEVALPRTERRVIVTGELAACLEQLYQKASYSAAACEKYMDILMLCSELCLYEKDNHARVIGTRYGHSIYRLYGDSLNIFFVMIENDCFAYFASCIDHNNESEQHKTCARKTLNKRALCRASATIRQLIEINNIH